MKVRVHELAKKYEIGNKEFLNLLKDLEIEVSSHLSGLSEDQVDKIKSHFSKDEKATDDEKPGKKKKKSKIKEKSKEPVLESKKDKNKKKKKGRRTDFFVKKADTETGKVVEEDGIKIIKMRGEMTLGEFAEKLNINSSEIIKKLFLKGQMLTINSPLSIELAEEIATDYDVLVEQEEEEEIAFGDKFALEIEDKESDLQERAPVITIMGHVDHGKTSLLDAIRKTEVVAGEAGGITQKIGAYQVTKNGKKITFVDTPGHEAFTDMRARGAKVTDIAILVVAADDGVMPQTIEAISHAKAAGVPIIVAINKIDKPEANPMRVKQELMEHGLVSVEWGGDVEFVEVSAKAKINLDILLETILLTAEILELKANPKKRGKGVVLESKLDPKVGPVADILVQEGNVKIGDVIVAGESYGKIRALMDDKGVRVNSAEMSQPVEVIGFNSVPEAGDTIYVIQNEQHARRIVEEMAKERKMSETGKKTITLESLSESFDNENLKELNLILRADSKGSAQALKESLMKLSTNEVAVNIIQSAPGAITESDIKLAEVSNAIIIGFNVRPTTKAIREAEVSGIEIRTSSIIYQIIEDIEKALTGMLDPEFKEMYLGRIEIKKVFKVAKVGNIAGCVVVDGKVRRDSNIRIVRDGVVVYEGKLASLKRFKDDAKEVVAGQECGLGIENFNDIKDGDIVEAFDIQEIKRTLR
ncbi:translation initiation factor IF-2 [Fusobacterium sp.]|uniref:translation initiation factor IF-2 n=1 Tax=Fusobacterium sp. TaxID=68766 RepID=UPI00260F0F5D|nr:translation initiation factor IF-2 [Fusobacterium sp.]